MSEPVPVSEGKFLPVISAEETLPPKRRRYTTAYKLRLIQEADACTLPGALASLLRKEGLYFSTLKDFRKQKARGDLGGTPSTSKALRPSPPDAQTLKDLAAAEQTLKDLAAAERENRKLRRELERAKALLELQKKVSELMGFSLETPE